MKFGFIFLLLINVSTLCCQSNVLDTFFINTNSFYLNSFYKENRGFNYSSTKVPDNPLFHMAMFTEMGISKNIGKKVFLNSSIFVEQRSFSGGFGSVKNLAYYPVICLKYEDTFHFNRRKLFLKSEFGTFLKDQSFDFLQIYNLDFQGTKVSLSYNKFFLKMISIVDLSASIGLNIDELYRASFGYKLPYGKIALSTQYILMTSHLLPPSLNRNDLSTIGYLETDINKNIKLKIQSSFRYNKLLRVTNATGISLNYKSQSLKIALKYRYYQKLFNYGFKNASTRFRDSSKTTNYIGDYLYPLKNYQSNFNQWAVFTNVSGLKTENLELRVDFTKPLKDDLSIYSLLDFNVIRYFNHITSKTRFLYFPIYSLGVKLNLLNSLNIQLGITNKYMNLDSYYQTFYISYKPSFSLGISTYFGGKISM